MAHHLPEGSLGLLLLPSLGHAIEAAPFRDRHLFEIGDVKDSAAGTEDEDTISEARGGVPERADLTCAVEAVVVGPPATEL